MYTFDGAAYKSAHQKDEHIGYAATDKFYSVAIGKGGVTAEKLDVFLNNVKHRLTTERILHLADLENLIDEELNQVSAKDISFSCIYAVDDVVYTVTRSKGVVYIFREGSLQKLISGNATASGYVQQADSFIVTTEHFFDEVDEDRLTTVLSDNLPEKLVEILEPELNKVEDAPLVAYFIRVQEKISAAVIHNYEKQETEVEEVESFAPRVSDEPKSKFAIPFHFFFPPIKILDLKSSSTGRKITLGVTAVLLVIFIWSVVLGNSRRQKANFIKEIQAASQGINSQLSKAEDVRIEDPVKALQIVEDAHNSYKVLAQKAQDKKYTDISELKAIEDAIKIAQQEIQKTEQSPSEEFYDLSLIKSDAQASKLYLDDGDISLLDSKNGKVYVLSVADKSVDTFSNKDIKGAQFVALHQGNPLIFKQGFGVIQRKDDKAERVIDNDKDWKNITDMSMFNGNIYLLAEGNDEVYKYLVAEGGYGDKTSYFKTGQAENMDGAVAMSIDSSVYIAKSDKVLKYTSGLKESFNTSVPDAKAEFNDLYTSASLQNVYLLDKAHATIFIFDKDGQFQKQVASAVIAKADDFVVDEEQGILILANNKIYTIKQNN
jgi:hypothetical protein